MKIFSLILAFYVLLLSTGPGAIDKDCESNNDPCAVEHPGHDQDTNECKECCSPFFACGACSGSGYPALFFTMTKPLNGSIKRVSSPYSFNYSEFHSSFWQPPEIS